MASSSTLSSNSLFAHAISEKLSKGNHALCKAQVQAAVRGARLQGHLTGASKAPDAHIKDKEGNKVSNLAFEEWDAVDQPILGFLLSSLSREILTQVSTASTAAEAWGAILAPKLGQGLSIYGLPCPPPRRETRP